MSVAAGQEKEDEQRNVGDARRAAAAQDLGEGTGAYGEGYGHVQQRRGCASWLSGFGSPALLLPAQSALSALLATAANLLPSLSMLDNILARASTGSD